MRWNSTGHLATTQLQKIEELQAKVNSAERRAAEAEHIAELAEKDARLKDKEFSDILTRIRVYESVSWEIQEFYVSFTE